MTQQPAPQPPPPLSNLLSQQATPRDEQIEELQAALTEAQDARREDQFVFIAVVVLLLDVVFFSIMPNIGGPIALLVLEMLILVPLAKRMGMEEIAQIINRVVERMAGKAGDGK